MTAAGLVINPPQPDDLSLSLLCLRYTSPEQAGRLALLDQRSDLYSLGIIFYEWLVGDVPFTTDDLLDLAHQQMSLSPVAPAVHLPHLPAQISELILKLLAKSPDARYASARGWLPIWLSVSGNWKLRVKFYFSRWGTRIWGRNL